MSSQQHHSDTLGHQPQEHSYNSATSPSSPTRAYFPPSKTTTATTTTPSIPQALSAASLVASLASKKAAYINHPSIQKVIASHTTKQQEANSAPGYYDDDDTIANIPDLDLLPPPPVYDIVNCSTSQTLLLVSSLINTILAVNDRLACPKITLFHSRAIPNISIEAYLSRILQYAPFQNEVLLIILLYFDRIGGGCKPTQVLTNTIPKSLLRQASLSSEEISQLTAPKTESVGGEYFRSAAEEKAKQGGGGMTTSDADDDILDEEEPIADEIYTSSSESPVGSKLIINSFNIHRLLITSILVACKFSSDVFYPNVRYARVGGLPLSELNQLELEFLFLSQFELNTTESELQAYGNKLLMYHQRMNGTERAAYDAITPAKGEYVRLTSEKKPTIADVKTAPPIPPRIQTSDLTQPQSHAQLQQRPSTESEPRPFVSTGPYRDSKEYIMDDDEIMSEKADNQVGSPADWRSAASTPVIKAETPIITAKYPIPRSSKMNLDHMIWPTNEMETKYITASHYGGMVMDEDAARIEEEFNKASPPPESSEPNPKRKLQRLSSGTMDTVPAKRANTPGKNNNNNNNTDKAAGGQQGSNKNILKPFLRKIASFAHRTEAVPVQEPEPSPQPPALRSHPYLVRHRISPASSSTNLQDSEEVTSPVTPTSSRRMSWQQQQQDEYSDQNQGQMRPPSTFQAKPPPPPYSGQSPMAPYKASSASTRGRRQHRSREPSLSSLASELTFEPTRHSLSPMSEEPPRQSMSSAHPATLAPFYFPPRPQSIQSESGHPLSPLRGPQQSNASPEGEQDSEMQCDEPSFPAEGSRGFQSEPLSASVAAVAAAPAAQGTIRKTVSERIVTEGLNGGASPSSALASSASSPTATRQQQQTTEHTAPSAGRQRIPRHAPSPTTANPPPVQYPHPHYVASYYHPAPNLQLVQDFKGLSTTTTSTNAGGATRQSAVPIPRNPQALLRGPQAILPAVSSPTHPSNNSRSPPAPALAPRPSRQFAPIRPRTPMMQQQQEEDSKDRVAQSSTETSSSSTPAPKKKRGSESKSSTPQTPQALRPLVPAVANAPPPYRPPFIAYPSPYTPHLHHIPNVGAVRPHHPPPMIMAVDYSHGAGMVAAAGGHGHQHFIAAAAAGPHAHGQHYPGGPPRLFIPVIPVMYNKPPPQLAPAVPSGKVVSGSGKTTTTPAKIAPRLHF